MKKFGIIAASVIISSTPLTAGNLVFEAKEEEIIIVEEQPMGPSGVWIIPLLAIALIALVVTQDGEGTSG